MKLHILGGPGSGKTTLARHVAARLEIPHHDLDLLGRKHGPHAAPLVADVVAIAQQPGWVTEGIYLLYTEPLLQQAEYVVLLDIPWPTAAWRIVRRHVMNTVHGTNQYPGWAGWKALFNLLKYACTYYLNRRPDAAEAVRLWREDRSAQLALRTADDVIVYTDKHSTLVAPPTAHFVRQYLEPYRNKVVVVRNENDQAHLLQRLIER